MRGLFGLLLIFIALPVFSQIITWDRTVDLDQQDYGTGVIQTPDGGFVLTGTSGGYFDPNFLICRLDPNGDTLWTGMYKDEGHSSGNSIVQAENGYIASGYTSPTENYYNYTVYVLKVNPNGDTVWTKKFDKENRTSGAIIKTQDGNYVLYGASSGFISISFDLIKLDENGTLQWSDTYSWPWGLTLICSLEEDLDGNFVLAGESQYLTNHSSMMITKIGSSGDSLWTHYYYGDTANARAASALPLENNEILICGTEDIPDYPVNKLRIIKVNEPGNIIWEKEYYQWGDYYTITKLRRTEDGNYLVCGKLNQHMFLMKIDNNGDSLWTRTFPQNARSWANDVKPTDDNGIILSGSSSTANGAFSDIRILKLDENGIVLSPDHFSATEDPVLYNFPNPFTNHTNIAYRLDHPEDNLIFSIFDLSGKILYQHKLYRSCIGLNYFDLPADDLPTGILYYSIKSRFIKKYGSMLKLK